MSLRWMPFALVVLAAPALPAQSIDRPDPPLALVGARVIVRPGAPPLEGATVLVRDGRIEAVGTGLELPFDARGVDVSGLTLVAGLLDAADERDLPFAERAVQQGRPQDTGRDVLVAMPLAERLGLAPERRVSQVLPQDASAREAARKAGFGAALVAPRDAALAGFASWLMLSGRPPREALHAADVAQFGSLLWRSGPEDYQGSRYPATLMGLMAHLRQVLLDARWQADLRVRHAGDASWRGVEDPSLEALAPLLAGHVPLVLRADEEEDVRLALGLMDEFPGLRVIIAGGREAWRLADELALLRVPVLHALDFGKEPDDPDAPDKPGARAGRSARGRGEAGDAPVVQGEPAEEAATPADAPAAEPAGAPAGPAPFDPGVPRAARHDRHRRWLDDVRGVAALRAAGVTVAFGTFGREAGKLLDDLRVARDKGGLSAEDALAGLTSAPSVLFGGRTPAGEVAPGAPALLTAWEGEPLAKDVPVRLLVVDGVLFDLRGLPEDGKDEDKPKDDGKDDTGDKDEQDTPSGEAPAAPVVEGATAAVEPVEWPVELDADREPSFRTGGDVLVAHATLLTASHGTLADHDLLVQDGRIAAIGRGLAAPDGVRVIDATGRFVMPGVIDCHSHAGIRGGVNEWTRVITPEVSIEDEVDPDDVDIFRALAGGVTAMRLLHGSANAIGGRHEVIKLRWGRSAPELLLEGAPRGVKFALGENPRQANSRESGRFPATRMGVEAVLRRAFEAGAEYRAGWGVWEARRAAGEDPDPPRRDLRLEALAGILDGDIRVHSHCYQSDEMLMLIRTCEEFGIRIATLQHVLEGYKVAAEIAAHGAGGSTFVDWWGYKFEVHDATPYAAALMAEAGVTMSVNSDSSEHLRRLQLEAAKTVRYGGTPEEQALRMVTLNPAIQLGIAERTGSLDVGKDADFAVFSAHPFDVTTRCLLTFVDGELYFERREDRYAAWEAELQRRLVEAGDAPPASPAPGAVELRARSVPAQALAALRLPRGANAAPSNPLRPVPGAVALVGGSVHTMERRDGRPVTHSPGVLLMQGGRVRGVYAGPGAPPDGYEVLDVSGKHVWPGLIDAGCSVGLAEIETVRGSMDVREIGEDQPDLRASAAWHADSAHVPVARANGTTTALVVPQGGRIMGQSSAMALEGWTAAEALVADAVALHVAAPRTPREVEDEDEPELLGEPWHDACAAAGPAAELPGRRRRRQQPPGELPERVRENWRPLREQFEAAREHARVAGEAAQRGVSLPAWDPRSQALAPYALGQAPVVFHADWADQIADALDFAREQGLRAVIAGGQEAWKVADRLVLGDVPVLLGPVLALPSGAEECYDAPYANAALLQRAGVRFAFRSNDSASARDLPFHAGMAVAFGLPEDEALHALTAGAADILGLSSEVGTLTPGKRADVLVTDGSPLQILTRIERVFIGGRDVGLQTRHTQLYEKYRQRLHAPGTPNRP